MMGCRALLAASLPPKLCSIGDSMKPGCLLASQTNSRLPAPPRPRRVCHRQRWQGPAACSQGMLVLHTRLTTVGQAASKHNQVGPGACRPSPANNRTPSRDAGKHVPVLSLCARHCITAPHTHLCQLPDGEGAQRCVVFLHTRQHSNSNGSKSQYRGFLHATLHPSS